jgi:hypothetical protein
MRKHKNTSVYTLPDIFKETDMPAVPKVADWNDVEFSTSGRRLQQLLATLPMLAGKITHTDHRVLRKKKERSKEARTN